MKIKIETDGTAAYEVDSKTRDIVIWERAGKDRGLEQLKAPSMSTIYELAHIACRRTGTYTGTFDEFIASTDIEVIDEDVEVVGDGNPT